jgi:hypothetical protein
MCDEALDVFFKPMLAWRARFTNKDAVHVRERLFKDKPDYNVGHRPPPAAALPSLSRVTTRTAAQSNSIVGSTHVFSDGVTHVCTTEEVPCSQGRVNAHLPTAGPVCLGRSVQLREEVHKLGRLLARPEILRNIALITITRSKSAAAPRARPPGPEHRAAASTSRRTLGPASRSRSAGPPSRRWCSPCCAASCCAATYSSASCTTPVRTQPRRARARADAIA